GPGAERPRAAGLVGAAAFPSLAGPPSRPSTAPRPGPIGRRKEGGPMHPTIFRAFEEICSAAAIRGPVLEVGAVPGEDGLLRLPCLRPIGPKVGLNLEGAGRYGDFEIVAGNANAMTQFADGRFGAVLCNATL